MIRTANAHDREAVCSIWEAAFGDPPEYIRFFQRNLFDPARCLLSLDETGRPVAMLHLLPADYIAPDGGVWPVQYLYAAATLPQYRRQGRMAALIEQADAVGRAGGFRFTFLLPAEEELYRYYAACGYRQAFSAQKVILNRRQMAEAADGAAPARSVPIGMEKIRTMRQNRFQPAVLWGPNMLAYVIAEWKFSGGDLYTFEEGYCLSRHTGEKVRVQELCVPAAGLPAVLAFLLRQYPCDAFEFMLPADSRLFPGAETVPYGMLRLCDGTQNEACDMSHAYINLLLD